MRILWCLWIILLKCRLMKGTTSQAKSRYVHLLADPMTEPLKCGVQQKSRVCDPTKILRDGEAKKLNTRILDIENSTPCVCDRCPETGGGYRFAIGLIPDISLRIGRSAKEVTQLFAEQLLNSSWNYSEGCGNDAVIIVNTKEKLVSTAIGKRTQKIIDADCVLKVYKASKDNFDASNYCDGLDQMLSYYATILTYGKCEFNRGLNTGALAGIVLGLVVAVLATFCVLWFCRQRSKKRRQKRYLQTSSAAKRSDISSPSSGTRSSVTKQRPLTPLAENCESDKEADSSIQE